MAISFSSAVGNLFNCLGSLGTTIAWLRSYQTDQESYMISQSEGITRQYNSNPDIQAIIGSNYIGILDAAGSNIGGTMQAMAQQTVNRFVFNDSPRLNQTLTSDATLASLQEIIRQMQQQGATVLFQNVTATPTAFMGTGNGVLNVSVRRPTDGRVMENAFAESINVICSADSYTGGATAGQESFNVTGTGAEGNVFAFGWPLGSNASTQIQMIDGGSSVSGNNLLNNSSFEDWTDDVPDQWELVEGTAGVDIIEAVGAGYADGAALEFVGDGSTFPGIRQEFNSSDGNTTILQPLTQYGACIFIRRGGMLATQGTLRLALVDVNDTPLQDEASIDCVLDIDLTDLTTDWQTFVVAYRTPRDLPDAIYILLQCVGADAPDSGLQIYMDRISLGTMKQIYTGGPFVCGHSGNAPFVINDLAQIVVTNDRGGAESLNTFQTLMFRLLPIMGQNELLLPSSETPSISDTLITGPL